jgi:Kef-type K+ transport system membrane component KefB
VLHVVFLWGVLAASASSAFAQPAAEPVPEPDVTAPGPAPQPDVTAAEPAAQRDVVAAPIPFPVPVPVQAADSAPDGSRAVALPEKPVAPVPVASAPSASEVVKAILGLLVILVLAYLAGHPRVQELEELFGLSQVVTAGFPFVLLGLVAHHPSIGILSDSVLAEIRPALPLGLGWIGFAIGFRFDARRIESLPRGIGPTLLVTSVLPFAGIVGACGLILLVTDGVGHGTFLRDAIILGTAGIIGVRAAAPTLEGSRGDRIAPLIQLQEGTAMIGLVVVAAFWRPSGPEVGWNLPGVAWLFVTLGMGTLLAAVIYAILSHFKSSAEVTLLMLGSICLSAGLSSYLRLSPIAVSFLAGALLFNFPGSWKEQVRLALVRLERPVYLVFLVIAGALWQPGAWQGWVLLLLFVPARLAGKVVGTFLVRQNRLAELSDEEQTRIAIAPMGALAIAIVVNAQDLYVGSTVSWMVTTVIGGAIASEIAVHIIMRRLRPALSDGDPGSPSGLAPPPREDTPPPFRLPPPAPPRESDGR